MKKVKLLTLMILTGVATLGFNNIASINKIQNKVVLTQHVSTTMQNNKTLTSSEINQLKNKTINVGNMKFSGLRTIKITSNMSNNFISMPGFNQNGFASSINEKLYNYELNPANDQAAMKEATYLHGGNPIDTCVFFQSSALRAIGQDVPYYIGYTTKLENWLANNGWERHTDFQCLQRGDIVFAGVYHTFLFMGWEDEAKGIAFVMGNESFSEPYYRNRNLSGQSPITYGDNSYYQATCFWTYGQGYTGVVKGKNPVHQGGYNAIGTATAIATLNIQAGPNTWSNIIGNIPNGVTVPVISTNGAWYKVYYNGVTGWIDGNYTNGLDESLGKGSSITNMPVGDNLTVTSPVGLWLTNGPSVTSGNIVLLPNGTPVKALAFQNGWYKVNYEGTIGWLDSQYTSANGKNILSNISTPKHQIQTFTQHKVNGTVTVDCDGLWLNKEPFVNDGNLIIVPQGTKLKATAESNNGWYKVTYKGITGWIGGTPYSTFTKTIQMQNNNLCGYITIQSPIGLYLNTSPTSYIPINCIPNNVVVPVLAENDGWYKVNYNGQIGWVDGQFTSGINNTSQSIKSNIPFQVLQIDSPSGLHMRSTIWGDILETIPYDTTLRVLAENDGWYKVNYNGQIGWVDGSYVNVI